MYATKCIKFQKVRTQMYESPEGTRQKLWNSRKYARKCLQFQQVRLKCMRFHMLALQKMLRKYPNAYGADFANFRL